MRNVLIRFARDDRGSAATEMALSIPILIILMFGSFELGKYFLDEHKIVNAVRDGARYAARQPFTEYPSCTPSGAVVTRIRNVTRTGQTAAGGTPRLTYWTNPSTITVTASCTTTATTDGGTTVNLSGIYTGVAGGAPVVEVRASVPYTPLFGQLGIASTTLRLHARSQATVNGI
jgi:Flp pilus assembly protein TadG